MRHADVLIWLRILGKLVEIVEIIEKMHGIF